MTSPLNPTLEEVAAVFHSGRAHRLKGNPAIPEHLKHCTFLLYSPVVRLDGIHRVGVGRGRLRFLNGYSSEPLNNRALHHRADGSDSRGIPF